jgi:hypothetical protein
MRSLAGAFLGVILLLTAAASARAASDEVCAVATHLVQADDPLPKVAAALAQHRGVTIAVVGTNSSTLPGPQGQSLAYPARLEAALRGKLPDVAIKVVPYVTPRRTAADMAQTFAGIIKKEQPNLVIWQTGTYDAMQGIAPEQFQSTLELAVDKLREGGADVILMNMQYSPRTDAVLASQAYAEAIRWVGLENGINLFDRQGVMRHWSELGTFDLLAATKSLDTAAQVHDCIGKLLADLITQALKMSETQSRETK